MSSVGGVGGGGRGRRAGGAKGPSGSGAASGAGKVSKAGGFGKVDKAESLVGPSGAAGSGNVGALEPMTAQSLEIARSLKAQQLAKEEAFKELRKRLVDEILQDKLRMKSKALTSKIAEQIQDDPRCNQVLERLWEKA